MTMRQNWKQEIARDILAIGGLPFYVIVIVWATIGEHNLFVYKLLVAAAVVYALRLFLRNANLHIARGFVLFAFTSLFYKDATFTAFAFLLWLAALGSPFYLKEKLQNIAKGVLVGIASTAAAFLILDNLKEYL